MGGRYEEGRQPCAAFAPDEEANWWGHSVHQCPKCWGRRVFCLTCVRDHHEGGWDACVTDAFKPKEEDDDATT